MLQKMRQASEQADIIELWLGELPSAEIDFARIFSVKKTPLLLNVKSEKERGVFKGMDEEKLKILQEGAKLGAEYCDFDIEFPKTLIKKFVQNKSRAKLILSAHYFENTPTYSRLNDRVERMQDLGADIVKIATFVKDENDLKTLLTLSKKLRQEQQEFIVIGMGEQGKTTRMHAPKIGSEIMFAALNETEKTAPGQMTVNELQKAWEAI